ncbi:copper homeostasis protein CutC [Metabacillus arenae]|uniref:PF03932 family protein CutC n=1 Tax=Metabacillus arenae TaxID=2771434 RepID=A0A926NJK0_9BACI|nr:copper homeostasis protein CutC [Metabacillus arenae]MBD1382526.1 copper homeostasis protein CutC [Metabacillus arenae]
MIIEVIADTLSDAIAAQEAGASRIELITGVVEGGLTPSYGLIEEVCGELRIPVSVMIRPHSRSFCYSNEDVRMMLKDIEVCKELGATGVVFGTLTADNQIDEDTLKALLDKSEQLDVTFHRAFDEVSDQLAALQVIQKYPQISRILTSGGKQKAMDAVSEYQPLLQWTENCDLNIMAGAGLTPENLERFLKKVNVKEIHFGSGVRYGNSLLRPIDPNKVKEIRQNCLKH